MKKLINILKISLISLMLIFLISFIFLLQVNWGVYLIVSLLILIFVIYLLIHIFRSKTVIYKCKDCNCEFKISFVKDITSYNAGPNMKVLVCPNCNIKEVMKSIE